MKNWDQITILIIVKVGFNISDIDMVQFCVFFGEKHSMDKEAVSKLADNFATLMLGEKLSPEQHHNADKTENVHQEEL